MKFILIFIAVLYSFSMAPALAQDKTRIDDVGSRPIYVTMRMFQLRAKSGVGLEATDQTFRMRTGVLNSHDKWIEALKKAYPGYEISALRTESRKVFRTARPTVVQLARSSDGRIIELAMNGAQSPGDGTTPGTTLLPEINLRPSGTGKQINYASHFIEVESGMTYFYAATALKLNPADYTKFLRPALPPQAFSGVDHLLVLAYSVDIDKTASPPRYFDERQSAQLQNGATKKVQPEIPASIQKAGLSGFIRVRVEIVSDGKVAGVDIQYSSFPELNIEALAAARQWEFPASLFAEDKRPITGFVAFSLKGEEAKDN